MIERKTRADRWAASKRQNAKENISEWHNGEERNADIDNVDGKEILVTIDNPLTKKTFPSLADAEDFLRSKGFKNLK